MNFFTRRFRCRSIGFSGSADGSAVRLGATLCAVRLIEGPRCALEFTVPTGTGSTMLPNPGPAGVSLEGAEPSSEHEAANLTLNRSAPRPRRRGAAKTAVTRLLTSASIAVLGTSVNWAAGAHERGSTGGRHSPLSCARESGLMTAWISTNRVVFV